MREHRTGPEVRIAGRTLTGTAIRYGDISPDFRERFEPGAFGEVGAVDLNLQHDPGVVLVRGATLTDGPRELSVRAELPSGSAALALVRRRALNGISIEFRAMRERRDPSGIRVVESADLTGLALVDRGAYPGSTVEVRARRGQTLRQTIPAETTVSCECSGGGCKWAEFVGAALQEAISEAFDEASKVIASGGSYQSPLASAERGSVRGRMEGRDAVIDVDLPEGAEGDAVIRAHENAGIVVRPYLDRNLSEGEIETQAGPVAGDQVMVYRKMKIRAIVVSATDAREGWPEPELIPTPEEFMERREAPRRRRLWL